MHKIGVTQTGHFAIEVTEAEYESIRALLARTPSEGHRLVWDAVQEEKLRFRDYQYARLKRHFAPESEFSDDAGITIEDFLVRLDAKPEMGQRPFGLSVQLVKKLRGVIELKRRRA